MKYPNINIRSAQIEDCAVIADIYNPYLGIANMNLTPQTADNYIQFLQNKNEREALYIMEENEQSIGWGIIKKYSDRLGYKYTCETSIYLKEGYTGRGLGTHFKRFIIQKCKELQYKHLVAKIWANNTTSIEYNKKLGYEEVGIQRKIGYVNDKWVDVMILQLILD